MASSVAMGAAAFMDGPTYNGLNLRPVLSGLILAQASGQAMSGVLPSGGAMNVSAGAGMSVNVATGTACIASSAAITNGGYLIASLTSVNLTLAGSDPTNARLDLVCATISDVGSSASNWVLQVITGTPSGSPAAPALPANSLALGIVLVPAGSSSVSGGNITDPRIWATCQGGIVPVPNLTSGLAALTPYQGLYVHDRTSLRLVRVTTGGTPVQPTILPFAPQSARLVTSVVSNGSFETLCSVNVTTDGSTDLEILAKWPGIIAQAPLTGGPVNWDGAQMIIQIDSTQVCEIDVLAAGNNPTVSVGGGSLHHVTSSGVDRPASGTHTVTLGFIGAGSDTVLSGIRCRAGASTPVTLYVRPAPL